MLLFQVAFFHLLTAQSLNTKITGTISNTNGEPLPFATISLKNSNKGTVANENGDYSLTVQKSGNIILVFRSMGFVEKEVEVQLKPGKTQRCSVSLTEESKKLNEVIISGKSSSTQIEERGFTATSIGTKELQAQSVNLNNVLNQNAGIRVRQAGGLGSRVNYSINGLEGKAVRFFLDGIPMDYFGSSFSATTIPVSLIGRVDVYKGVVPVELGSDALGGAVNLVSKKDLKNNLNLSYSVGSFNTHRASLSGFWRNNKNGFTGKLTAFYNYSDNSYKVWGEDVSVTDPETLEVYRNITAKRFHDAFESKAIKTDMGFTKVKAADQFFMGLLLSGMDKEIQHGATMIVPFGEATYKQSVTMPYFTYQKNNLFTEGLSLSLFASYSNLNRSRVDTTKNIYNWLGEVEPIKRILGGEQKRTLAELTENAFLNRANIAYTFSEKHKIGFNQVFSHVKRTEQDPLVTQKTEGYYAPQYFSKNVMGLTLQSSWFDERFNTNLFAKSYNYSADIKVTTISAGETTYETVTSSENSFGAGLAASFHLSGNLMLSASLEQASRLPEANEILGDGLNIISNPKLQPESSFNANLGFNWNIQLNEHNRIQLSPNVFYRNVSEKMKLISASDPALLQWVNFDEVRINGIDGRFQYFYKQNFRFTQSLSYLNPVIQTDKDEFGNDNGTAGTRLPNTPFFQANSEARYSFNSLFRKNANAFIYWRFNYVGAFYRYSEKFGNENKDRIPKQNIHSIGAAYTFPNNKLTLSADASNIFNAQVFDNYAVQKPGRAFYIKISYQIF